MKRQKDIPDRVAEAAFAVFREKGYEGASVRDIAARAGLGVSGLYAHISSKEDLFLDLMTPVIETAASRVTAIAHSDLPPREKLEAAILSATKAFDDYPDLFVYLRDFFPVLERSHPEIRRSYEDAWVAILREGMASGVMRDDLDPKILVNGILGMVGWMYRWYRQDGKYSAVEVGAQFVAIVLDGLSREHTSSRSS